ncbi:MAG: hypothetical protein WA709_31530 [Stellaceae bacterium]
MRISTSTSLAARAVALRGRFYHAHLPDELPRPYRAEQDGLAIESSEYINGTPE